MSEAVSNCFGEFLIFYRVFQVCWTTATDFMSKFVTAELPTPYLIVINSTNYEHFLLHEHDIEDGWNSQRIMQFLDHVSQGTGAVRVSLIMLNQLFS